MLFFLNEKALGSYGLCQTIFLYKNDRKIKIPVLKEIPVYQYKQPMS